ncbi:MAG: YqgE/AlgH family protein [Rickettsiales endosymbiont of Dermacentor nuttalli]
MAINISNYSTYWTGKLLIATPTMPNDSFFSKAVVYLLSHNANGAVGFVVNQTVGNVNCSTIFNSLDIIPATLDNFPPVYLGGPVEAEKGFILHTNDYNKNPLFKSEIDGISVSSDIQILKDIANGQGPNKIIFALGYAGWQPGQLEDEVRNNHWLVTSFSPYIVFANNSLSKWNLAMDSIGIKSSNLSVELGHA